MTDALPVRDRARTQESILAAARDVLAEDGFQGFGVNSVARRARCDKQLIYRYFGGLDGLVEAIGADLSTWLEAGLVEDATPPPRNYADLAERLILGFLDALRGNRLVQQIAAWEIAEPSPLTGRLAQARGMAMAKWVAGMRGELMPPDGVDAPATNAFLIAAIQQLVLASSATGTFAGMDLRSEADWDRLRATTVRIVRAVYSS